ncbi:GHMP family kinase ATP-binding protein [Methanofollis fontis]|uniref:GHMP kinase n=1 Tax=Methanofollis fontis TaxID=2052832 RepID=A0A483CYJ1_9EURY|nr:GHMP kinase [Methanofollis fontis]TAJ44746.1 GHMP kinase [Methanofollis fontis]
MPMMKIRGGDLDLVEYEFESFSAGENVRPLTIERELRPLPQHGTFIARAPARIHATVLDMNRFAPGQPGGGGFGYAVGVYCTATAACTGDKITIEYGRVSIIRHIVEAFRCTVGYNGGFHITAQDHHYRHVGLGSTGTILVAVCHAMNAAVGSPLTPEEIRILVGRNFIEETADDRVAFGFETGVGPSVSTYGGFVLMGDDLTLVYKRAFAVGKNVFIIIPSSGISSAGTSEFNVLMNRARDLDYRDRSLKTYMAVMDLIPALERGDLRRAGDVMWEFEFRGSKRAEIEHHSFTIYAMMSGLRNAGLEFVGMSSVGPSIAVITEKSEDEVRTIAEGLGLSIALSTAVDNDGIRVGLQGE